MPGLRYFYPLRVLNIYENYLGIFNYVKTNVDPIKIF